MWPESIYLFPIYINIRDVTASSALQYPGDTGVLMSSWNVTFSVFQAKSVVFQLRPSRTEGSGSYSYRACPSSFALCTLTQI